MDELLLSDDELCLIWHLPYITEQQRLKAIARARVERILELKLLKDELLAFCSQKTRLIPAVS